MDGTAEWLGDWQGSLGLAGLAIASFVIGLSGALMPGPLLVTTLRETARQGPRAALLLMLGHGTLEAGVVILASRGLIGFLQRPGAFAAVALLGAVMLAIMAVPMLRSAAARLGPPGGAAPTVQTAAGGGAIRTVCAGVLTSLSNPYWSLWWVTVGVSCLAVARGSGWAGPLAFFAGHILADLAWYWFVARCVWSGRNLLNGRLHRGLLAVCGCLLLLFAAFFAIKGLLAVATALS
jgi:threonine/homoserine/homoserine lactone efflux protein